MKKSLLIIISIVFLTGIVVFLLSSKEKLLITPPLADIQTADTEVFFSPNPITTSSNSGKANVIMDTGRNTVSFVQIVIKYDPKTISFLSIQKGDFFKQASVLQSYINNDAGKATYILNLAKGKNGIQGKGTIASIQFTTTLQNGQDTPISFTKESLVTDPYTPSSLLEKTTNSEIYRSEIEN